MKVGFTGTQNGMSHQQKSTIDLEFFDVDEPWEFHHGDCIGSDDEAAHNAKFWNAYVVGHPPINQSKRAFFSSDEEREPKEYLVRNHDIVDEVDKMYATPKEFDEQLRSGTWATIRYAKKVGKPLTIIYPDGSMKYFNYPQA